MAKEDKDKRQQAGTQYGFPQLDRAGEETRSADPTDQGRAALPPPRGRTQTQQRLEQEAASGEASVLRRVEHELSEPARFTPATEYGRPIMRDAVEGGLVPVKSEELVKQDLLEAEQPPAWQRLIEAVTWTRTRLFAVIGIAAVLLVSIIVLVALKCGSTPEPTELATLASAGPEQRGGRHARIKAAKVRQRRSAGVARSAAQDAAVEDPPDLESSLDKARKLVDQGFCPDAEKLLVRLIEHHPQAAPAHFLLGRALACRGRAVKGLDSYERALSLDASLGADKALIDDLGFLLTQRKTQRRAGKLAAQVGRPAKRLLIGAATHRDGVVRQLAVSALLRMGAANEIDWRTSLWLDLQQSSCKKRPEVITRIVARVPPAEASKLLQSALGEPRHGCVRARLQEAVAKLKR